MITPKVSDITGIINKFAPFKYAEGWDNVGLQVGDPAMPAEKIMVALDAGKDAVNAAVAADCRLLLTHHPLLFAPLKKISLTDHIGSIIAVAIKHDLAVVSLHTNYDIAEGGMNDLLAEQLGVSDCVPLKVSGKDELVKLSVYVPKGHEEQVLSSLFKFSGFIGKYSDCSFQVSGTGTFKPQAGAKPFLGEIGKREQAEETRLEVLLRREDVTLAVNALRRVHPYEEPAFDLYPLLNEGNARGLGRIGALAQETFLGQFTALIKERLSLHGARYVGDAGRRVKKIALCGGSGASLLQEAHYHGADVLVTGDIKYHDAREAEALGLALVDAGHFATEKIMIMGVADRLRHELAGRKYAAEILTYEGEREPFSYV